MSYSTQAGGSVTIQSLFVEDMVHGRERVPVYGTGGVGIRAYGKHNCVGHVRGIYCWESERGARVLIILCFVGSA